MQFLITLAFEYNPSYPSLLLRCGVIIEPSEKLELDFPFEILSHFCDECR